MNHVGVGFPRHQAVGFAGGTADHPAGGPALGLSLWAILHERRSGQNSLMYPLHYRNGHLFIQIEHGLWLLDTGAPTSFGDKPALCMQGQVFHLPKHALGVSAAELSSSLGVITIGLIGADIISRFDLIIDVPAGIIEFETDAGEYHGRQINVAHYMGIPVIPVQMAGQALDMYLDTGSRFSYVQDEFLEDFPQAGLEGDWHHEYGEFEVMTHHVPLLIGNQPYNTRVARLPERLGMRVLSRGPNGILGNEWLAERRVGYFPGRGQLLVEPISADEFGTVNAPANVSTLYH